MHVVRKLRRAAAPYTLAFIGQPASASQHKTTASMMVHGDKQLSQLQRADSSTIFFFLKPTSPRMAHIRVPLNVIASLQVHEYFSKRDDDDAISLSTPTFY